MKVALVCSSGGHLAWMLQLRPWWSQHERFWVTFDKTDARSLLEGERTIWAWFPTTRSIRNLLRNLRLAWTTIRRERPDVIVSTGAGVALPFFLVARLHGIKTVFIESYERIEGPSLTARLCSPLSHLVLLQWDDQLAFLPGGQVIGRLL